VHGGGAARGRGPAEAAPRGGAEAAGPRGRRRCTGPRGSSQTGGDAQGCFPPRGRGDARGYGVTVAASPRSTPPQQWQFQDGARLILHGVQRTPLDAQADALRLRRTPYASRQGDGDAYHLEGAWTPSRRLGDALRTLGIICLYSTSLLRFSNIYSVCSVHV